MSKVEKRKRYFRIGDMHHSKALNLWIEQDGDIVLYVSRDGMPVEDGSVEFCETGSGGGLSPNVRGALVGLIRAIEQENEENPDQRVETEKNALAKPLQMCGIHENSYIDSCPICSGENSLPVGVGIDSMNITGYKQISKALNEITRSKFMEILLPHYNFNRDYIIGLWDSFDSDRLRFCLSRNPIEPGNAILEYAIVKSEGQDK